MNTHKFVIALNKNKDKTMINAHQEKSVSKLLIFTMTLFSTIFTLTMHTIPSQLQKRAYATMAKKDFNKLVGLRENVVGLQENGSRCYPMYLPLNYRK